MFHLNTKSFFFFPFVFYFPFSITGKAGICKALINTWICSLLQFSTNALPSATGGFLSERFTNSYTYTQSRL